MLLPAHFSFTFLCLLVSICLGQITFVLLTPVNRWNGSNSLAERVSQAHGVWTRDYSPSAVVASFFVFCSAGC